MGRGKSLSEDQQQKIREKIDELAHRSAKDYSDEVVASELKKEHGIQIAASGVARIRRKMKIRIDLPESADRKQGAKTGKRGRRGRRREKGAQGGADEKASKKPRKASTGKADALTLADIKAAAENVLDLVSRYEQQQAEKREKLLAALS